MGVFIEQSSLSRPVYLANAGYASYNAVSKQLDSKIEGILEYRKKTYFQRVGGREKMYLDDIAIELFQRPNPEAKLFGFVLSNLCVVSPEMMEIEFQEIEVTELSTLCIYDLKSTKLFRNRFIQLNFLSLSSLASNIQILVADEFGNPIDKTVKDVPRDFIDHEYEEIVEFVRDLATLIGIRSTTGSFYNLNKAPHLNLRSLKPCKITRIST